MISWLRTLILAVSGWGNSRQVTPWLLGLMVGVMGWGVFGSPAISLADTNLTVDGGHAEQLFAVHCVGCHPQGGNIIRRGKTLKLRALQRHQMDSVEAITPLIAHGKGLMSAFQDTLSPDEIQAVATYVLQQAEANWP